LRDHLKAFHLQAIYLSSYIVSQENPCRITRSTTAASSALSEIKQPIDEVPSFPMKVMFDGEAEMSDNCAWK